jgi:hypothetical protein
MYVYADLNEFKCWLNEQYSQKVSREGGTVLKKVTGKWSTIHKEPT